LGGNLFPEFITDTGETAAQMLRRLTFTGAEARYGALTAGIRERLTYELEIICQLGFADYFLLVWDLVQYARREEIRYAGRGSAADSAVAYCLYITEVDSIGRGLLFERFMSLERAQKPDIDIDFDSRYRDKVSAYVYKKYGADKVATVCTYNTYHFRSAIRELGKVMGFTDEELGVLAKKFPHYAHQSIDKLLTGLPELRDSGLPLVKYQRLFDIHPMHEVLEAGRLIDKSREAAPFAMAVGAPRRPHDVIVRIEEDALRGLPPEVNDICGRVCPLALLDV
jgi:error-prone DNA polymerase